MGFQQNFDGRPVKLNLGELTFDSGTRQVLRGSTEVHLSPKAFDLLKVLIERRPHAIAKRELLDQLWPGTFVSEANLAGLITEIRQALGDDARRPRFIRTAHGFGYAFCGDAIESAEPLPPSELASFCWLVKDGRRLPLKSGENVLGRDEDGIQIESPTVSRRHARIVVSDDGAVLDDLGSKNGTFVCGAPTTSAVRLQDGDEIRTGSVVFHFRMTIPKGTTATWSGPQRRS